MKNVELVGLQKYIKKGKEEQKVYDAAVIIFEAVKEYSTNSTPKDRWEALKDLVESNSEIARVMKLVNQAYFDYKDLLKEGKVEKEEQEVIEKQIKDCNNMLIDAYKELIQEGRIQPNEKQSRKSYSIEEESELNQK